MEESRGSKWMKKKLDMKEVVFDQIWEEKEYPMKEDPEMGSYELIIMLRALSRL